MKKLKLVVEQLAVESFATAASGVAAGTVHGYGTQVGDTCQAVNSCGPQTCGQAYCVIDTDGCGGTGTGGTGGSVGCPTIAPAFTCDGCTSYDYTNRGGDSCDYCLSIYTDSPQHCPCP